MALAKLLHHAVLCAASETAELPRVKVEVVVMGVPHVLFQDSSVARREALCNLQDPQEPSKMNSGDRQDSRRMMKRGSDLRRENGRRTYRYGVPELRSLGRGSIHVGSRRPA